MWASDAGVRRATRALPLRRGRPGVAAGLRHGEGAGAGRGRSKEKAPLSQRSQPFLETKQIVYKPEIIQSIKQATMEMKHHRVRFYMPRYSSMALKQGHSLTRSQGSMMPL